MSGVENGAHPTAEQDDGVPLPETSSPPSVSFAESGMRRLGVAARSSSPAKRSASERDEDDADSPEDRDGNAGLPGGSPRSPKKSSLQHVSPMPSRFKSIPNFPSQPSPSADIMEEDEFAESGSAYQALPRNSGNDSSSTAVASVENEISLPGKEDSAPPISSQIPSYDEQVETITSLIQDGTKMRDGARGFVISRSWMTRLQSRTSQGLREAVDKMAREGDVGPVDNSTVVENDNFYGELKDEFGDVFVPLQSQLNFETDFEVVPEEAWKLLMHWYGLAEGSHAVVRYARNTSELNASSENLQYELFPPICTIQRTRQNQDTLKAGPAHDQDVAAVNLVASRTEGYQGFLKRAKTAAGIPMTTKVRAWKILDTLNTTDGRSGIPTPASSRSASPVPQKNLHRIRPKLFVDPASFELLEEGTQREKLDIKDETANEKYNGHLKLDAIGFPSYVTLVLEEQLSGSGAEEFPSDRSKLSILRNGANASMNKQSGLRVKEDSAKPSNNSESARRSPTPSGVSTRGRVAKKGRARGCTGLVNLGNTCYMNSALQCIRSVEELSFYFLEGKSHDEINASNPLGHGGQIAKAYEELVRRIFSGSASFSPQDFRRTLGRCQPLFSGYGQQDSQEFLSFLVDGLHEDLNRVIKKPYMENPESDDDTIDDPEAIRELGEKFRENHKARNDSVAMDLFNGFYKNTMICPVCDKISITFDPYSLLTLQLPIAQTFQHTVTVALLNAAPVNVEVDMDKNSSIRSLKDYLGARVGVPGDNLVITEMYSGKFYKIFEDAEVLSETNIQPADKLLAWQLDQAPTNWPPLEPRKPKSIGFTLGSLSSNDSIPEMGSATADRMAIPVVHRINGPRGKLFDLIPSFVLVTKDEARDSDRILRKVLRMVNTLTTRDIFNESEELTSQEPSSRADSDAVIMDEVETSSSDDQKIQARSVESEEGLVDISMTDNTHTSYETKSMKKAQERNSTRILDPGFYIQPEWRQLFEMKTYTCSGELVPCAWSNLNESDRLNPLESRRAPSSRSSSRRASNASLESQTLDQQSANSSADEDDDELIKAGPNHISASNGFRPSSPDSDSSQTNSSGPDLNIPRVRPTAMFQQPGAFASLKKGKNQKSIAVPEKEFVLRLGEGLVLDWSNYGMEQLFEKGERAFENIATVPDPELEAKRAKRAARKKKGLSLEECFEETARSEILSEDNAWYCGRCKDLRRATKKLEIWTVPDILVVHLKRFSTNSRLRDKIDVLVDFPVEDLNLEGKVGLPEGKPLQYDLFAVDNHYGGLGGGHYTAYAQNFYDKKWYDYNDQMVTGVSPESVVTRAAYLLFYRRRSERPLGGKFLEDVVQSAWAASEFGALSGEDSRLDDSLSNGSSNVSLGAGAEVNHQQGAQHLHGSAGGHQDPENIALGGSKDSAPPSYNGYDEAIGMEEDVDEVAPGLGDQRRAVVGPQLPTWGWDTLGNEGVQAPPTSSNGNSMAGSDKPEAGETLRDRLAEDFPTDLGSNNDDRYLGRINLRETELEDDNEVAEIKVSSDNEEGI